MEKEEISDHESLSGESGSEQDEREFQSDPLQLRSFHVSEALEIPETVEFDRNVSWSSLRIETIF